MGSLAALVVLAVGLAGCSGTAGDDGAGSTSLAVAPTEEHRIGPVLLTVPADLTAFQLDGERVCLAPKAADPELLEFVCDGIYVVWGDSLSEMGPIGDGAAVDLTHCDSIGSRVAGEVAGPNEVVEIDGARADRRAWRLECAGGGDVTVTRWSLADPAVLLVERREGLSTDPVLPAALRFP